MRAAFAVCQARIAPRLLPDGDVACRHSPVERVILPCRAGGLPGEARKGSCRAQHEPYCRSGPLAEASPQLWKARVRRLVEMQRGIQSGFCPQECYTR